MKNFNRTFNAVTFIALAFQAVVVIAMVTFIWWMFAHGFHDLGQFILKLAATSQA